MYENVQVLLTLFMYLAFFGWVGWRRGTIREGAVLITTFLSWWLLQNRSNIFVGVANGAAKVVAGLRGAVTQRSLGGAVDAVGDAQPVVTPEVTEIFVFGLWVALVVLIYVLTNNLVKNGGADGWSIMLGMANGLLFGAILLPRLLAPLVPGINTSELINSIGVFDLFSGSLDILSNGLYTLWDLVEPQSPMVILMFITLLLVLAAMSLRRSGGGGGGGGAAEAED